MISIDKESERTNIASKRSSGDQFSLVIWEKDKTYFIINCRDFVEDEEIQIDSFSQCEWQLDLITRYNSNRDNS
ncbi:hypothetical protein BpHYR1_032208 [Brachionus plicatilis]|uniref:Uncharacterized protein n=1 Tax=Brachionus plicatilis TaxID=10195 RepID=A0A3M7Q6K8_BRAPC|nr:hypothetical protein BpHYR1_032208 [Brachionus plicatilis]